MLGRTSCTRGELDNAHRAIDEQPASCRALAGAAAAAGPDEKLRAALDDFQPVFSTRMVLILDRFFVHRLRTVTGKDANPLNEVELLTESRLNNGGVFRTGHVVKWVPEQSSSACRPATASGSPPTTSGGRRRPSSSSSKTGSS